MTESAIRPTFGWRARANNSSRTPHSMRSPKCSQWLRLQGGADTGEMLARLERALASAGLNLDEAVPLVAELLQLPVGERYPALALVPEQKRRRLFAVLLGWIFGAARLQQSVVNFPTNCCARYIESPMMMIFSATCAV